MTSTLLPPWQNIRRLLLVRLDKLGDVLLQTPAFRALRVALPHAETALPASPVGAQVGRLNPDLEDVIMYDAPWIDPWCQLPLDPERIQAMIRQIAARQFDGAIVFTSFRQSSLPAAMMCYLAGISLRAAAATDAPGWLLTTRYKHFEHLVHEAEPSAELGCCAWRTVSGFGVGAARTRRQTVDGSNATSVHRPSPAYTGRKA